MEVGCGSMGGVAAVSICVGIGEEGLSSLTVPERKNGSQIGHKIQEIL